MGNNNNLTLKNPADITHIKSIGNYIQVFYINGECAYSKLKIKNAIKQLNRKAFIKTHRSHIVNMNFVERYYMEGRSLKLKTVDGEEIPISKGAKDEFKKRVLLFPLIRRG
jgi:DNA-binding LytR/AlgR family response regulator